MKIWKRISLITIILAGLNGSCSVESSARTTSPTPSFASVPLFATQTGTPTTIATNLPVSQIDFSCWTLKPLKEGNNIKGSFFYFHYAVPRDSLEENDFFVWDISSFHSEEHVLNKRIRDSRISFNGSTVEALGDEFFFISNNGIQSYPLPEEPLTKNDLYIKPEYPRPDGRILIPEYGRTDSYKEGAGFTDMFYIFEPETRKISVHQVFLPNLHKEVNKYPLAQYSPSMKYALYMSTPTNDNPDQFIIYDMEKEETVISIPPRNSNLGITGYHPRWLPNRDVVIAEFHDRNLNKYGLYFVSPDGTISPIADLPDYIEVSSGYFSTLNDWSPNNRYFALADSHLLLYIWDNQAKTLYHPCLPNEHRLTPPPQIDWSFEGNYLVVTLVSPSLATPIMDSSGQIIDQKIVKKYILDLVNKIIYELPEDVNEKEYPQIYINGHYQFIGWVNWEFP